MYNKQALTQLVAPLSSFLAATLSASRIRLKGLLANEIFKAGANGAAAGTLSELGVGPPPPPEPPSLAITRSLTPKPGDAMALLYQPLPRNIVRRPDESQKKCLREEEF